MFRFSEQPAESPNRNNPIQWIAYLPQTRVTRSNPPSPQYAIMCKRYVYSWKSLLSNPYLSRSSSCCFSSNEYFQLFENENASTGSILTCIVNSISNISYFCVNALSTIIPEIEMDGDTSTEENGFRVKNNEWIESEENHSQFQ